MRVTLDNSMVPVQFYSDNSKNTVPVVPGEVVKRYKIGQQVTLPFLNLRLELKENPSDFAIGV